MIGKSAKSAFLASDFRVFRCSPNSLHAGQGRRSCKAKSLFAGRHETVGIAIAGHCRAMKGGVMANSAQLICQRPC